MVDPGKNEAFSMLVDDSRRRAAGPASCTVVAASVSVSGFAPASFHVTGTNTTHAICARERTAETLLRALVPAARSCGARTLRMSARACLGWSDSSQSS